MLRLRVENYRAIKSATVELSNLTVLAGVNSSGKSTIARLFHRLVCLKAKYEAYAAEHAFSHFRNAVLEPLSKALPPDIGSGKRNVIAQLMVKQFSDGVNWDAFQNRTMAEFEAFLGQQEVSKAIDNPRFVSMLNDYLYASGQSKVSFKGNPVANVLEWIRKGLASSQSDYESLVANGAGGSGLYFTANVCGERLEDVLEPRNTPECVLDFEDDHGVIARWSDRALPFPRSFSPRQSYYIARPAVDFPQVRASKLTLNGVQYRVRSNRPRPEKDQKFVLGIEELIGGTVSAPPEKPYIAASDWRFSQNDGRDVFDLSQCADGIKSLSTLSILDRYRLLDDDALLVIDEPEVHLHPQWIVETARILVGLAKYRNVKVLITTHSPDLVHALRDFTENENFSSGTCFYLSMKEGPSDTGYTFRRLGMNIGPIFSVFNVAKDQIQTIARRIRETRAW